MIIYYQIPLTDIRLFLDAYSVKLSSPFWPTPAVDKEFVRSFGSIKQRGKGGVKGWMLENELCIARKALRIVNLPPFNDPFSKSDILLKCIARLFYLQVYHTNTNNLQQTCQILSLDFCHHVLSKIEYVDMGQI